MKELVIYKPGNVHLNTFVKDGICAYTGGKTVSEYLETIGPDYVCIPYEEALVQITEAEETHYITDFEEITEEEWEDMLNCLPPCKWQRCHGIEFFYMCEMYTGNISSHFARVKGLDGTRCFKARRRITSDYALLAAEIRNQFFTKETV